MNVKKVTANIVSNKNLRPLSEYSGPVLKLTKKDKEKISALESSIAHMECDIYDLNKQLEGVKRYASKEFFFIGKIDLLQVHIENLQKAIKQIKIDRLNKQKAKKKGVL